MIQESQPFHSSQNKILCNFGTKTPQSSKKHSWPPKSENETFMLQTTVRFDYYY